MRSKQLQLDTYDTDKVRNGYLERYDTMFEHIVERDIRLLELGVHRGGSLLMWHEYFPLGTVVGVDLKLPSIQASTRRLFMFQGDQTDTALLTKVAHETAPDGFDVIIDDASHIATLSRTSFLHLFHRHLKPGGLYVIEDWGTGYWDDWPDGRSPRANAFESPLDRAPAPSTNRVLRKIAGRLGMMKRPHTSHQFGMVGFVMELVDEVGAHDASRITLNGSPKRHPAIEFVTFFPSLAFVKKA